MFETILFSVFLVILLAGLYFILIEPIISVMTGKYDCEKLKLRIKGLENKLGQFASYQDWSKYVTDEEKATW